MQKTLIIWHRFGKEHREESFKVNPPDIIHQDLKQKAEKFHQTPASDWRWWQLSDDLLIEKGRPDKNPNTLYYYLIKKHWLIIENASLPKLGPDWAWYIHIGDTQWHSDLNAYVFKDLFLDVWVHKNNQIHTVVDMDDLAKAIDINLITAQQSSHILRQTQTLLDTIQQKQFPPPELSWCREQLIKAGLL